MTPAKPKHSTPADTSSAVEAFLAALDHPHAAGIRALRALVLAADPSIAEGIKWNAPSFRTHEYFATTHLRAKLGFGLILHLGAKARVPAEGGLELEDPTGLLTWLAQDRAVIHFDDAADLGAKADALAAVIRAWIRHV